VRAGLVGAQDLQRIQPRSAIGRSKARQQRHERQDDGDGRQRERIGGAHAEDEFLQQLCGTKRGQRAGTDSNPEPIPIAVGVIPSDKTRRSTSRVRAPSAVRIPISRLRPRTM
jgi:hypothetical protein